MHQHCLLRYGRVHLSKQQQFPLARLCLWFVYTCPSRIYCGDFVGLKVAHSSSNRLRSIFLTVLLVVSSILALITVFLEFLGSLHIFAIFGSNLSVGGLTKGMVPVF